MKKLGLFLAALTAVSFASCGWGGTVADTGQSTSVERRMSSADWRNTYIRINPKDPSLSDFVVQDGTIMKVSPIYEEHDNTYWHLSIYKHGTAERYWDAFKDYGLKTLGSKASIEYWEDKHPWYEYDHYHWYLVVNDTRIAEYEKVGGAGSAAHDHVRLLKSWWDWQGK